MNIDFSDALKKMNGVDNFIDDATDETLTIGRFCAAVLSNIPPTGKNGADRARAGNLAMRVYNGGQHELSVADLAMIASAVRDYPAQTFLIAQTLSVIDPGGK